MEGMMPGMGDAYGIPDQEEERENVSYSKTKSKGDATVTVSANASSMQELHDVLRLAGITLPKEEGPSEEPEAEVSGDEEPETAVIVHPDHEEEPEAPCDGGDEDPACERNMGRDGRKKKGGQDNKKGQGYMAAGVCKAKSAHKSYDTNIR